jgi:hypothetical protein
MLIDRYCPSYRFSERHSLCIPHSAAQVYAAVKSVRFTDMPTVSRLLAIRSGQLGAALRWRPRAPQTGGLPVLDAAVKKGFIALDEAAPSELVLGAIGRFWRPSGPGLVPLNTAENFLAFSQPGYAKLVLNFHIEPQSDQACRLHTQTRIAVTDRAALYKFAAYWCLIRPGSGLIRRLWLRAIAQQAASTPP